MQKYSPSAGKKRKREIPKSTKRKKRVDRWAPYSFDDILPSARQIPSFPRICQLMKFHEEWQLTLGRVCLIPDLLSLVLDYLDLKKQISLHRFSCPSILRPGGRTFLYRWCRWYYHPWPPTFYQLLVTIQDHFPPSEFLFKAVYNKSYSLRCTYKVRRPGNPCVYLGFHESDKCFTPFMRVYSGSSCCDIYMQRTAKPTGVLVDGLDQSNLGNCFAFGFY